MDNSSAEIDFDGLFFWLAETASQGTILFGKVQRGTNGDPITGKRNDIPSNIVHWTFRLLVVVKAQIFHSA